MNRFGLAILLYVGALAQGCAEAANPPAPLPAWHPAGDASLEIEFVNGMSAIFSLKNALFVIDDQAVFLRREAPNAAPWPHFSTVLREDDAGPGTYVKAFEVYRGPVPVGTHTIGLRLLFKGSGLTGYADLAGYTFDVRSQHKLKASEGGTLRLTITAYEQGGPSTPLEQRPTMNWEERFEPDVAAPGGPGVVEPDTAAPTGK